MEMAAVVAPAATTAEVITHHLIPKINPDPTGGPTIKYFPQYIYSLISFCSPIPSNQIQIQNQHQQQQYIDEKMI